MFKAMIFKELLLISRDKHALAALFILPAVFILIMSLAMKDSFSTKNLEFSLYVRDLDRSDLSQKIVNLIQKDKNLHIRGKNEVQFVVTIPKNYSKDLASPIRIDVTEALRSDQINAFEGMLLEKVLKAKLDVMSKGFQQFAPDVAKILSSLKISTNEMFEIYYNDAEDIPNATQQSVPAWIVFGMFFIIIPMSTIYVNERKQNTLARLSSMNVSLLSMGVAKSIPYLLINQLQVVIMLGVGCYLVPLFDAPALEINGSFVALEAVSLALSIAAIGISSLIAVSAHSSEQATTIGGIFNILLGAIGGVMVPKFVMPPVMQELTQISPMAWGLDAFLDIFLKSADLKMVMGHVLMLLFFGGLLLMLSMLILRFRITRGL